MSDKTIYKFHRVEHSLTIDFPNPIETIESRGYKKAVKNKFKIESSYTDKRAPYYDEGDVITSLVEKVLRNIVRSN